MRRHLSGAHRYVFVQHAINWHLLFRFGLVGGSGALVNLAVIILLNRLGPDEHGALLGPVRWYHAYAMLAFLVANVWNYQVNRTWTFTARHTGWLKSFLPFMAVGLLAQVIGLVVLTGFMGILPTAILDDTSGLRTRLYWAQLLTIMVTTPLSFVLNKVWTFKTVRAAVRVAEPTTERVSV